MSDMCRIPVTWTGLTALPGVSVFYSTSAGTTAAAALKTFFTAIKGYFNPALTWQVPGSGDKISDLDGSLAGTWTMGGAGSVVGSSGTSAYAAGCGLRVRWNTAAVVHGRRVRGSTFLAPIVSAQYDTNGTIVDACVTAIQTAANALVADGTFLTWSRPYAFDPEHPDIPARVGAGAGWTSAQVLDQVTSLRSRRV